MGSVSVGQKSVRPCCQDAVLGVRCSAVLGLFEGAGTCLSISIAAVKEHFTRARAYAQARTLTHAHTHFTHTRTRAHTQQ